MHIILVINCGSSSIKYQLFRMPSATVLASGLVEKIGEEGAQLVHKAKEQKFTKTQPIADHAAGMEMILWALTDKELGVIKNIDEIRAVGHRVVHGGEAYSGSVKLTDDVIKTIREFFDLAPLHNPPNLTGITAAQAVLPKVPQVAVFDTAFHQSIPRRAYLYALPYDLYDTYRIRRYGFHGTSHHYVTRRAAVMLGKKESEVNLITCHLGNGCSITAVKNGKSVDTSMGLTPLEGVAMGTRSGDIDPSIIYYLMGKDYDKEKINNLLNKRSGLLGISGISNDMRTLVENAAKGNERAQLAIDIFAYRIRKYVGSYLAVLGQVDAVVFMGGIGENNAATRYDVLSGMAPLGVEIDKAKNAASERGERDVATAESRTRVFVIPTDEEGYIAQETHQIVFG